MRDFGTNGSTKNIFQIYATQEKNIVKRFLFNYRPLEVAVN